VFNAKPHRWLVPPGGFEVADAPTAPDQSDAETTDWKDKLEAEKRALGDWQHKLYAADRHAMLLIFQALDAAGKDGTIRRVLTGVNPTGIKVCSFKQPSSVELEHDFLWRTIPHLPARGEIGVFNRSYYEEVLVVRVHPEWLGRQRLPEPVPESLWYDRFRSIVDHERHLADSGTVILKFWLNVSKRVQRERFLKRIETPEKHWKFRGADIDERRHWERYVAYYEECLNATSRPWAPWYAIPADNKSFMRWQVARLINEAFEQLGVDYPKPDADALADLLEGERRLRNEPAD
jgi:PPK2 family polyphosphate:nucleotide phosphotransferase